MSVTPKLRIPSVYQSPKGEDLAPLGRFLENSKILQGELIEVDFVGGATQAKAKHGLNRSYIGGIIVGYDTIAVSSDWPQVLTPGRAETGGVDPAIYVWLACSVGYTGTVNVWVF